MLLNCNSCKKKFVVPDSAITKIGRLVQCGSCGSKWTQFPIKNILAEKTDIKEKVESNRSKKYVKKPKLKKNLYTTEFLLKKHGLIINDSNNIKDKKSLNNNVKISSFGFYSYLIFLFIFLTTLFAILELSKEIIILKYPFLEIYIVNFYEVVKIIKISITQLIN
jgi:predicted Zn finger-like uncharacterized protein